MKKSQLQSIIREEVKAALGEASNPELDRTISQFVAGLAKKYDYQQSDAVMAVFEAMKRLGLINKNTNYMAADGLSEGRSSEDGYTIHSMVGGGQDSAQDFIDDNNIDAQKLIAYIKQNIHTNPAIKYDVRDYIIGASGTVGGEKHLRDKFIKQFQLTSPLKEVSGFSSGKQYIDIKLQKYPKAIAKIDELIAMIGESKFTVEMAEWLFAFFNNASYERPIAESRANAKPLKEYTSNPFKAIVPGSGRPAIDPAFFAKLMPKSARTSKEAYARIQQWNGKSLSVHSQYFEVTPNGNMPNRPIYQLHQQQYGGGSNVTFLTVIDVTDKLPAGRGKDVGVCYVDTKVFLQEYKVLFELIKREM